ncbi:hypothetical protein BST29_10305 [Mycobacterium malmoense]|uniref:PE domain-containing protein n=1 Tax=Mycobacterium malmoense TaxID=1780 RepID=A0ABX3SSQ0_MYCMA|nr:hypothetical protein BST29_10305 [Mycobacterium malmoense]
MVVDLTARPHVTAGIALASAAVLAAGPMAQHLPEHLPAVSMSAIQLTDAASGMVDLFSGVENDLASLASGSAAAAVPASLAAAALDPTQNLIVQTWMNTFEAAGANLQGILDTWSQTPFLAAQQVAANGVSYANLYVSTYQTAAQAAVQYFFGTGGASFGPLLQSAWSDYLAGDIPDMTGTLFNAFWGQPLTNIGLPMEAILYIPNYISQNFATAVNTLGTGYGVPILGELALFGPSVAIAPALGDSLQAASTAWAAGEPVVALTNLLNTPGATVNAVLNGSGGNFGLLSNPFGITYQLVYGIPQVLAQSIVAPNATNIANGGSLSGAFQGFVNQLINGWPSLSPVINGVGGQLTSLLQSIPSVLSNLPSILGTVGATLASNIGLLISNLLKLL